MTIISLIINDIQTNGVRNAKITLRNCDTGCNKTVIAV
jgi:hypothetical protein